MIHSSQCRAVLDANVLYPIVIRDILFWLAYYDLFTPLWSDEIFKEWKKVFESKGILSDKIQKSIIQSNVIFPFAKVTNYEYLIPNLKLPDPKDNHVLAAAITSKSDVIVTLNIKDFPEEILKPYQISAKTPDDFLTDIIDLNQEQCLEAFREMVMQKTNPNINDFEMLEIFRNNNLTDTANYIKSLL